MQQRREIGGRPNFRLFRTIRQEAQAGQPETIDSLSPYYLKIRKRAREKLDMIDQSQVLDDLRVPHGSRLEALEGDRADRYSIRVNDQWRVCFRWIDGDAYDVEITDYH